MTYACSHSRFYIAPIGIRPIGSGRRSNPGICSGATLLKQQGPQLSSLGCGAGILHSEKWTPPCGSTCRQIVQPLETDGDTAVGAGGATFAQPTNRGKQTNNNADFMGISLSDVGLSFRRTG